MKQIEEAIQDSASVKLEHVSERLVATAKACFKEYRDKYLSVTAWTIAVMMKEFEIEALISFDGGLRYY